MSRLVFLPDSCHFFHFRPILAMLLRMFNDFVASKANLGSPSVDYNLLSHGWLKTRYD